MLFDVALFEFVKVRMFLCQNCPTQADPILNLSAQISPPEYYYSESSYAECSYSFSPHQNYQTQNCAILIFPTRNRLFQVSPENFRTRNCPILITTTQTITIQKSPTRDVPIHNLPTQDDPTHKFHYSELPPHTFPFCRNLPIHPLTL